MKLKASETAFILICLLSVIVSASSVYLMRDRNDENRMTVLPGSKSDDSTVYDIAVLNSASIEDFMAVSGIGEVKARDIIAYRDALGGFRHAGQLKDVSGISDALYQRLIEYFYPSDIVRYETTVPETVTSEVTASEATTVSYEITTAPSTEMTFVTTVESITAATDASAAITTVSTDATAAEVTTQRVMQTVNVNQADAEEIADALIIDIELAEQIVALREKIHVISNVQEIYAFCEGMTTDIYRRIKDYVIFD